MRSERVTIRSATTASRKIATIVDILTKISRDGSQKQYVQCRDNLTCGNFDYFAGSQYIDIPREPNTP